MSNLSSRLAGRKPAQKDVPICLNLALLDERDEAMRALDAAARTEKLSDDRMVSKGSAATSAARAKVDELDAQIRAESIIIRVKGVGRDEYNQWIVECPPKKGQPGAFDPTKFYMHAVQQSAVYVDEKGVEHDISAEDWATIDRDLNDGEHDRLAQAVVHVNREVGQVDVGFFGNGSDTTRA